MKKVFIGCAAVLLSLGLLAGCDNEEGDKAVSIKVDNAATVVVGDILELPYTVEPEKAKIEVLNEYEEYVTAEAEDGVLYLEGLSEGDATITLVGTYRKYTEANVNISVSVVTKSTEDTEPEPVPTPDTPTVSFSLSEISCDLTVGETVEIEYTLDPSDATVVATSGNDDYVTAAVGTDVISLTGIGEGTTTVSVTASCEGYISATETISVSVAQGTVAVTGVSIDQGSQMTLAAGATTTLTATVTPANATNPAVTWAVTGSEGVITLDTATGEVTAGSDSGSTEVTVTTVDGGYTDSIAITVEEDVVPEVESIAFDSNKTYSVEKGQQLDVANDVVATWKDNVTGDTPEYVFSMTSNDYASLSDSVITGVASTYGVATESLPVVTASITGNSNVASASQAITVTEAATLTGISFTSGLPTSVDAGATIDLSQYISITGTGDDWESLANAATVTYELGSTSVASISESTVTTVSTITEDASITVTAKLADYGDATSATATISVVAPLTIVSAAFEQTSYELTVGTEMDFASEIEVTYNKTDSGSIEYSVALSASPDENLEISGTKVTATGNVTSATLTATITWSGGSTTCTTSISAEPEPDPFESYTVKVTLQTSGGQTFPEPGETYGVWIQSAYDGVQGGAWGSEHQMTYEGSGVYTYTFGAPNYTAASYETHIIAGHDGNVEWKNFGTIYLNDKTSETGAITESFTVMSEIGDTWETIFPVESDVDVNFYVVVVFANKYSNFGTSQGFQDADVECWNGNKYCSATKSTTTEGNTVFYSEQGTAHENAETHFAFYDYGFDEGTNTRYQYIAATNIQGDSAYVVEAWGSGTSDWDASAWWNATEIGWKSLGEQSIEDFVASITLS